MPRSVSRKAANANEVSVYSTSAEQSTIQVSCTSAEQSTAQVSFTSAEQRRSFVSSTSSEQSTSSDLCKSAEQNISQEHSPEARVETTFSMDMIPNIEKPSRQEGDSPRSAYTEFAKKSAVSGTTPADRFVAKVVGNQKPDQKLL